MQLHKGSCAIVAIWCFVAHNIFVTLRIFTWQEKISLGHFTGVLMVATYNNLVIVESGSSDSAVRKHVHSEFSFRTVVLANFELPATMRIFGRNSATFRILVVHLCMLKNKEFWTGFLYSCLLFYIITTDFSPVNNFTINKPQFISGNI